MKRLTYPIRSKYFERSGNNYVKVSLCSLQGRRINMEDSHVVRLTLPNHPDYSLFGIFDGHNGKGAAEYLSNHIVDELDKLSALDDPKMIQSCIMKMDKEFLRTDKADHGSCMVFVVLKPILKTTKQDTDKTTKQTNDEAINDVSGYQVSVFWAGDSRCLWFSPDTSKGITKDHVPTNTQEKERIEKAEGSVVGGRVDARLAVSRAFGDSSLKDDSSKSLDKQKIVALCDYQIITANPGDWLFLYCDGLTEKWTNEQIAEKLKNYVNTHQDAAHALGYMFDEVLNEGSGDNITACLIQLESGVDHAVGVRNQTFLPGPLYLMRHDPDFVRAYMENANFFGHTDTPKLRIAAYKEDLDFLRRFGQADPDFSRHVGDITKAIRELELAITNDIETPAITSSTKETNMGIGNIDKTSAISSTSSSTDVPVGNKKRRITLDQWVYVRDNTL